MADKFKAYIIEHFIDKKFRERPLNYCLQTLLIFACISVIMILYGFLGGIIVASLGASSFILFVFPHSDGARVRFVLGGYICAAIIGNITGLLYTPVLNMDFAGDIVALALISGLTVALTTFVMITINLEHPPAAALALGLVTMQTGADRLVTALAAVAGVIILCLIRKILRKRLINLK